MLVGRDVGCHARITFTIHRRNLSRSRPLSLLLLLSALIADAVDGCSCSCSRTSTAAATTSHIMALFLRDVVLICAPPVARRCGRTKVVVHVSLDARCNDIDRLVRECHRRGVAVLEDSAQSLGSFYRGRHLGTIGDIGSFSFSSPKIISTGQGGALVTNSDELAHRIGRLKDFGRARGGIDIHDTIGMNFKFTDLQAVIGIEQMKKLPWRVARMCDMWCLYVRLLRPAIDAGFVTMMERYDEPRWIPWFIDIYVDDPDRLAAHLKQNQIGPSAALL